MNNMIFLKISRPGQEPVDAILGTALISIGSADDGSVQLDADDIQAQHVKIESANRHITALSSLTQAKVTVNGERIVSATLENGDVIGIGDYSLQFFHSDGGYDGTLDTKTWKVPSLKEARRLSGIV